MGDALASAIRASRRMAASTGGVAIHAATASPFVAGDAAQERGSSELVNCC